MGGNGWYGEHNAVSTFFHDKPNANRLHPTMKPVPLVVEMLNNSIPSQGTVFEPFLGSGTTLIAAEQTGMGCVGFELDEKYCTVVLDRWEQLTGQTGKLAGKL
jgi:site-specific DNA-methyltransferase (adenine-specific)